jgi:hypothetical protein
MRFRTQDLIKGNPEMRCQKSYNLREAGDPFLSEGIF